LLNNYDLAVDSTGYPGHGDSVCDGAFASAKAYACVLVHKQKSDRTSDLSRVRSLFVQSFALCIAVAPMMPQQSGCDHYSFCRVS